MKFGGGAIIAIILVLVLVVGGWYLLNRLSYQRTLIGFEETITAQNKDNENVYDTMWKVLQQKAGVTSEYKDSFKEIYKDIIGGRYSGEKGQSLMKWITESNPQFDSSMYKDLMVSIEALRKEFRDRQSLLIDKNREYNTWRRDPMTAFFLGRTPKEIKITIITSSKTEQTFSTGKEDDVDLFKK